MRSKTLKYVDQERPGNFSCEHENTLKSMEFSKSDEQLCLLTVYQTLFAFFYNLLVLRGKKV